ncbi:MAG: oxygen-insensitive NAD(P)H nitroreductase [Phycisphaerae bacterium]|nr:oxygen-insensitive NAD(P)H nitroreductase [Phycisphaerae bacterium]MBM90938.1 oxygen-insensitive NAD(P)H nitroreductase [Phycisphaerae bacterium]HCT46066.1 oxygen-insensitive NAD(P)H nitroreductase [Phycisphaerales bacterium]
MQQDIIQSAKSRHTAKAYDPSKKISDADLVKIKELLRLSASSTNAQPWFFVIAGTDEGKSRVAKATEGLFAFNKAAVLNASHVVVFAARDELSEAFLQTVLDQEAQDGRYDAPEASKEKMHEGRKMFYNLHKEQLGDAEHWLDKQVYLNLGSFLLGVSALGIDATPMEGFDTKLLDKELGLDAKGMHSLVIVPIGYHDESKDYNAKLPKSRLPYSEIIEEI